MADGPTITEPTGYGLATVMARKGVDAAAICGAMGLKAADGPGWTGDATLALIGTGPGVWLALAENAGPGWADDLEARLSGLASVSDQTSGYVLFRIAGPGARVLLQRGIAIDLHPGAFAPGSAATSVIAHIGVLIRQVDDAPTYDIAVFRSLAEDFRYWLNSVRASL